MSWLKKVGKSAKGAQVVIQLLGVIISAVVAAVSALQMGGDPMVGAGTGAVINALATRIGS